MRIKLHCGYARICHGDWTVAVEGDSAGGLDAYVIAKSLTTLQNKAARLRNLGYQVSRTAFQQYGHGVDSWQRPHYNAI
jgi:hypothetical protein